MIHKNLRHYEDAKMFVVGIRNDYHMDFVPVFIYSVSVVLFTLAAVLFASMVYEWFKRVVVKLRQPTIQQWLDMGKKSPQINPPNGESKWRGSYTQNYDSFYIDVFDMTFDKVGGVTGGGVDEAGRFKIEGKWENSHVALSKTYKPNAVNRGCNDSVMHLKMETPTKLVGRWYGKRDYGNTTLCIDI